VDEAGEAPGEQEETAVDSERHRTAARRPRAAAAAELPEEAEDEVSIPPLFIFSYSG